MNQQKQMYVSNTSLTNMLIYFNNNPCIQPNVENLEITQLIHTLLHHQIPT